MENFIIVFNQTWGWLLLVLFVTALATVCLYFGWWKINLFRVFISILGVLLMGFIVIPLLMGLLLAHWALGIIGAVLVVLVYQGVWRACEKIKFLH